MVTPRYRCLLLVLCLLIAPGCVAAERTAPARGDTALSVVTFNIWGAGGNEGKGIEETLAVLRALDADIIGLQETQLESEPCSEICPPRGDSVAPALARALGYHLHEQVAQSEALWANAILSRYPIVTASPHQLGVQIDVKGRHVWVYNLHLTDYPYQPFQALGIPYGDAPMLSDTAALVASAEAARGPALALLRADLAAAQRAEAVFVTGDFNEPSFRDWTEAAAEIGRHPLAVPWPTTRALEALGFVDALRDAQPDVVMHPAFTWSPRVDPEDPADHPDRIDYVFVRGATVRVEGAQIVGEPGPYTDRALSPWPSDHRAVWVRVRF